jgi:hypothetical protein
MRVSSGPRRAGSVRRLSRTNASQGEPRQLGPDPDGLAG